jgi:hypothetical protein
LTEERRGRILLREPYDALEALAVSRRAGYSAGMDKQRLQEMLSRLHGELSETEDVDPETVAMLERVTDDIERLLEKSGKTTAADMEPVSGRLQDLVLKFEGDHPQLSALVGKVADALAAIGI